MVRFSSVGTTLACKSNSFHHKTPTAFLKLTRSLLSVAASVLGSPAPITPDPNGAAHVGNGKGEQFITGACLSTADCGQTAVPACCAFIAGGAATGICSGVAVANVNGKAGCGFGDPPGTGSAAAAAPAASPSEAAAAAAPAADAGSGVCAVDSSLAGSQNVGKGAAAQFITGQCFSKADCASGCCVAQASGPAQCKAQLVTTQAGKSCDFSCSGGAPAASTPATAQADTAPAAAAGSGSCAVNSALAGSQNVGTGAAAQFITGQCFSKADCASGCCVAQADGTAQCKAQLVTTQAGKSCDFSCTPGSAPAASAADTAAAAADTAAATPSAAAAAAAPPPASGSCSVNQDLAGNQNVGKGAAAQFITGQCFSDGDCASGCCVGQASGTALCKAKLVTQQAGLSCGFTCAA